MVHPFCGQKSVTVHFTTTPVLAYPDTNQPFILDRDANGVGIGAILSQVDGEG